MPATDGTMPILQQRPGDKLRMTSSHSALVPLQSRAYQLEMFRHSLESNIIVVMGTGTGKTHVASLRIDAELRQTPHKQVWFIAPKKILIDQQLAFLNSQLTEYNMRALTSDDSVDTWMHATIWERVLKDINVVVATPQVLLDALHHAYIRLQNISLLVFDEAHHCQANDPSALIMRAFYHPQKLLTGTLDLPHVLGLTASPRISDKSASVDQLEANLDAKCRSPTVSIEQYRENVHKPRLIRRNFTHVQQRLSILLQTLEHIVGTVNYQDDPYYKYLCMLALQGDTHAAERVNKYDRSKQTPAVRELRQLLGNTQHLHDSLGSWAADLYLTTCISRRPKSRHETSEYHDSHSPQDRDFINERLHPLYQMTRDFETPNKAQISSKAIELTRFLIEEYREDIAIIVFVERRSAAWALCQLLRANPSLNQYSTFSYVSLMAGNRTLGELSTTKDQEIAFQQFRNGSRNLCIATPVAEEGIDIQAVNIVIRYDDPKQVVSYLQSRGRARQKDSKIVCFQDVDGEPDRYAHWDQFERDMEHHCQQEDAEFLERLKIEEYHEDSDEVYLIESTGARLDFSISVSHLAHFCAKTLAHGRPVYGLGGEIGIAVSATVQLSSCIPPPLRVTCSCQTWRSEKMARRDAAFHAMKALHIAGLINDHLMPFEEDSNLAPLLHEKKSRTVQPEYPVWMIDTITTPSFAYRFQVSYKQSKYLNLIIILSTPMNQELHFPLFESPLRKIDISVVPLGRVESCDAIYAKNITEHLFQAVFQSGSASDSLNDPSRLSCAILPETNDRDLDLESKKLPDFMYGQNCLIDAQPLLIWKKTRPRPYIWYPPHSIRLCNDGVRVLAAKQVRRLQIFSKTFDDFGKASLPQDKELDVWDCEARGLATVYGPSVLLLPTILHLMAAAIRAQYANQLILNPIGFSSMELVVPALIAKSACGTLNYERLEFLGDACLKYLASIQMFFDHPDKPEGLLTRKTHEIIGNTRLEEAITNVGLVPFITTETPAQRHWMLPRVQSDSEALPTRSVLSKTLADVFESILGAAYLDGRQNGRAIEQCIKTLNLFVPEIEWRAPAAHIERHDRQPIKNTSPSILQQRGEQMLGFHFEDPSWLVEALTHSTDFIDQPALDRLEFLGDAILDQIIKVELFESRDLDAGRLTLCRHALASHAYLAYCALGIYYDQTLTDVSSDQRGNTSLVTKAKRVELTDLIKFHEASLRDPITISKAKYDTLRASIESELDAGRFPWSLLRSLNAPKVCSDIIESLLGAIYLDSKGSLVPCKDLLVRLGMMKLLDQVAGSMSFEVKTPGTILRELCADRRIAVDIESRCEQHEGRTHYIGEVHLEGNATIVRDASCLEEAKSVVAEAALAFLFALREPEPTPQHNTRDMDVVMSGTSEPDHDDKAHDPEVTETIHRMLSPPDIQ